jgi:N-acetylmuramoyl-L-alanine amidase
VEPASGTANPKLRRQVLQQAVRQNVMVKEGKREPVRRVRSWLPAAVAIAVAVPLLAAVVAAGVGSSRLPPALAALLPIGVERLPERPPAPAVAGARATPGDPGAIPAGSMPMPPPLDPSLAMPRLVGQPDSLDRSVFPVGVRRIVLDPGHGGKDLGTVTAEGTAEKELALDISQRLAALLRQRPGIEVLLTRNDDREVVLKDRARYANEQRADLFVSIHLNWLQPASNRGVETFYLGATQDPYLVQLASRENRESGYALADVRRLLDGIYLDLRQQESQELAAAVQKALFQTLERKNPALRDRGVKSAPFLVLVGTQMPAILAEVSCLSNQKEAELLGTEAYRQTIAEALLEGLDAYTLNLSDPAATGG